MVTRLTGGLTPADGGDPRTFPAIWNSTATVIESNESGLTTAQSNIATLQTDVDAAELNITSLQSDVSTAQSDITSAQSDITTLQSDMTTAQSDITTLQGQVGATELFKCGFLDNISMNGTTDDVAVFDTANEILNVGSFTFTTSAITVPTTGVYMVSWAIYMDSTVERANPGIGLRVNSADEDSIFTAHSYIRNTAGHGEVTSNASGLISLSANDTVGLRTLPLATVGTVRTNNTYGSFSLYRVGSAS